MRIHKLSALLLALGAVAFTAAAADVVVVPAPAPYTTDNQVIVEPAPAPVIVDSPVIITTPQPAVQPDPAADQKCHFSAPNAYWDCVNSHNGG